MKSSNLVLKSKSVSKKQKRFQFTVLTVALVVALVILYFFNPATSKLYPPSPFRALTSLFCPGCGTLRGLHQLLHGHWLAAFRLNPLMILSLPFMIYAYISYAKDVLTGRPLPTIFIKAKWIWLLLKVIMAYWVLRNISIAPFSWLAP